MGRSSGLGGIIEGVTGKGGTLTGRGSGIPMPILPTESVGMMSGSRRTKRQDRRSSFGGMRQVTKMDPVTGQRYGGLELFNKKTGKYEPQYKTPTREEFDAMAAEKAKSQPPRQPMSTEEQARQEAMAAKERASIEENRRMGGYYDPNKPSAVMETTRVNVQDPTLGGPPEREVPIPKERDTSPRGAAPFSPDERAMARDAFFEKMFSRADERKQSRAMDQEERRNVMDARRDEAAMRAGERGMRAGERGMRDERGGRRRGRRMRRRDFTRKRSKMEGRRSREERAAFRDRFVSTLR
tara:strand:- start:208 stop:1098 length:891 start_codon:yes stop_codon:yes gene_type:complete